MKLHADTLMRVILFMCCFELLNSQNTTQECVKNASWSADAILEVSLPMQERPVYF